LLWSSLPYQPIGVHLAVVDPGVGTQRRAIAIQVERGDRLVGPDNGLLMPAAERLGGIVAAHELTNRSLWRETISSTFHGRDLFAPVAAHLAIGTPIGDVGAAVQPDSLVGLVFPSPQVSDGGLDTSVLFVDAFGNARLAGETSDLAQLRGSLEAGDMFTVRIGARILAVPWQDTFGSVPAGDALLYEDADYAGLAIAVNQGSAADELALVEDKPVRIVPA
jgi:S-adenosylmethionine hydrolase